jgi:hypothetical protein
MGAPRLSSDQLWEGIRNLQGRDIQSLSGASSHRINSVDEANQSYTLEYPSGNTVVARLDELYRRYAELYATGSLTNAYMRENVSRILGWSSWERPGSSMFAILPRLDDSIRVVGGSLQV